MGVFEMYEVIKDLHFDVIGKALVIAFYAHSGQRRKDGPEYITHPLKVAAYVTEAVGAVPSVISAALLHDVVEESDVTLEDLSEAFWDDKLVVELVANLTKFPGESEEEYMEKIKNAYLGDSYYTLAIKLADILDNLETIHVLGQERMEKYIRKVEEFYLPLAETSPFRDYFCPKIRERISKARSIH